MLVSDLKTALKKYGFNDEDPLLPWLNASYHTIEEAYEKWSFLERTEYGAISAGGLPDGRIKLLGDVQRMVGVQDITDISNGGQVELEYYDRRKFNREIRTPRETGNPQVYTIVNSDTLQIWPIPGSERELESIFIEELPDLVLDGDEPKLPTKNHYLIVEGAAAIALQAENEEDRASNAQAIFDDKLGKMIIADMRRQVGQTSQVEIV